MQTLPPCCLKHETLKVAFIKILEKFGSFAFCLVFFLTTCNAIVVDGGVVLRGVLVDVHLVHLRRLAQLGQLGLWDVGEALRLERLQVGQVLACRWTKIYFRQLPG